MLFARNCSFRSHLSIVVYAYFDEYYLPKNTYLVVRDSDVNIASRVRYPVSIYVFLL